MVGKILVVEDDPLMGQLVSSVLHEAGYEVEGPATSMKAGLAMVKNHTYTAAVLDYRLGPELVVPLAWKLHGRRVPFVIHTTEPWDRIASRLPLGFCYVSKPCKPEKMRAAVAEVIGRKDSPLRSMFDRIR